LIYKGQFFALVGVLKALRVGCTNNFSLQYNPTAHREYGLLVNATLHACTPNTNKRKNLGNSF